MKEIHFALEFPQGFILALKDGGVYFQPRGSANAYMVYGERKELFGKNAITVSKDHKTGAGGYSVVYEFAENGALLDARLVKGTQVVRGKIADLASVDVSKITFYSPKDTEPAMVLNVARFLDGRLLIQLFNHKGLYLGTPGNYTKLDAELHVQGGNSMYYKLATGEEINLPYGYGGAQAGDIPEFNGEALAYLKVESGADPAKFGLVIPGQITPVDPFSAEAGAPKPAKPQGPQP